ncbi:MAG: low molecular weight phosphotyrosine protein phosphatase, partial [Pseudomonadota bacterium]
FDQSDLIIGMAGSNIERMEVILPAPPATPPRRMTDFASALPADVPDPYYTGDYGEAFDLIEAASDALLAHLQSDQR